MRDAGTIAMCVSGRRLVVAGVQVELRSGDDSVLVGGKYANCVRLPAVSAGYRTQFGHGHDRRARADTEQHASVTNECHD